ncbi:conserved hypothetical protein, partial [Ixodes scapularis]
KDKVILLYDSDGIVMSNDDSAKVLNEVFVQSFSRDVSCSIVTYPTHDFFPMDPLVFDFDGIVKLIDNLKVSSSCGIDNINTKFLRNTKIYGAIFFTKIFEQSILTGVLPEDWKTGKVVPLHKSGDKHCFDNYRPISITSTPCKMLEHIIYSHLVKYLESNSFFSSAQHGFRKFFSCETQLLVFTSALFSLLDHRSQVDCIFLDSC